MPASTFTHAPQVSLPRLGIPAFCYLAVAWASPSPADAAPKVGAPAGAALKAGAAPASAGLEAPKRAPGRMKETRRVVLPRVALRGYGFLEGRYLEYASPTDAGPADARLSGLLFIQCDGEAKAKLTLAKYRSDLGSLGGVSETTVALGGAKIPALQVSGQGYIVAARQGPTVVIVTAPGAGELAELLKSVDFAGQKGLDYSGSDVPAYLNKFDRWGFGFWSSSPLNTPDKQEETYDVRAKFEWAQKMGVGLQPDVRLNPGGGADGVLEDNGRRWAFDLARDKGIPVTLQMQGDPAPGWIGNRYADEMQRKIPHYVGSWYGVNGNNGFAGSPYGNLSWASVAGKNALFAAQVQAVRKYKNYPNLTAYGEWHGEVNEGPLAMFMDYGPVADARYRDFLLQKYGTPQAVDARWSGGRGMVKTWADVRMPEPAEFLGWSENAVDLKGAWRLRLREKLEAAERDTWFAPELNDDAWRRLTVPGDDRQLGKEKWRVPTIFRRTVDLTEEQVTRLKASGKTYLYAWTLEEAYGKSISAYVNGKALPDQRLNSLYPWVSFDVTGLLHAGTNQIALSLPWGEISYRIYFSSEAPLCYPALGPEKNARWVDYRDFIAWMREDGLRRSIEAIRREDPDKFIKLYAPGFITDVMKGLSEDYGCYFHDTGGMTGNWDDALPGLMRSSGLPMSLEPGGPARNLPMLQKDFGHWLTEGLQAVDYFMDIGDVLWRPDQKAWFEAHQPLVHLLGKCHVPQASVAVLEGERSQRLTGFPWDSMASPLLWGWRRTGVNTYGRMPGPRDLLNESDFARGNASKYKIIVDDATLVMDDELVAKIEAWVRAGGTFITQGQSGRHSPTRPDTWPIHRLTGYRVKGFNDNGRVTTVAGQPIFTNPFWTTIDGTGQPSPGAAGVLLEKVAPECRDILTWHGNGGIAMGVRDLGQGRIITMGTAMPNVDGAWEELLAWCGVKQPAPAKAADCRVASFVSNNGLYDVYVMFADKVKAPGTVTLTVPGAQATMLDMQTGGAVQGTVSGAGVRFAGLKVEPLETYVFLAPRSQFSEAPLSWLKLQRDWWKGTKTPAAAPGVKPSPNVLALDADWAFQPFPAQGKDAASLASTALDDSKWPRMDLGIWYGTKYPDTRKGVFRKRFTVPATWSKNGNSDGQTWLWLSQQHGPISPAPYRSQIFLDGRQVYDSGGWLYGRCVQDLTSSLTPGEHLLTIVTESNTPVGGIAGNLWLEHIPEPPARQTLAGDWRGAQLPGLTQAAGNEIARDFTLDDGAQGKRAVLYVEVTKNNITGVILNGRIINRDLAGGHFLMDLTPYLQPGKNTLTLHRQYYEQPVEVKSVELRFYEPGSL